MVTDHERSPFARPLDGAVEASDAAARPARALPHDEADAAARPARALPAEDPAPARRSDEPPRTRRPRRNHPGLWVGLVIALTVLAILGAFAVRAFLTRPTPGRSGPEQVARDYLAAVAASDSDRVRNLAAIRVDSPQLTDETLRAANKQAPITDVTVESVQGQDVVLAYRLGGRPVRGTFPTVHVAEGWRVRRPSVRVRVAPSPQMIAPLLDGAELQSSGYTYDVELTPGLHRLSLPEGAFLEFEQPDIVVTGLTDQPQVVARTRTRRDYPDLLKQKLQQRVQQCLASKELAPEGCPWAFRTADGETVDPASVRYTMVGDPFASFRAPAPGTADAIVRGELRFTVKVAAKTRTRGGRTATVDDEKLVIGRYEADLADPELPFIWAN